MSSKTFKVGVEYEVRGTDKVRADDDVLLQAIESRFDKVNSKIDRLSASMKKFSKSQIDLLGGISTSAGAAADRTQKSFETANNKIVAHSHSAHKKITDSSGEAAKQRVNHIKSTAEIEQQYSNKSTAVVIANILKNIKAINDERRFKEEAIENGDKAEAAIHTRRIARIQIEQNSLRTLAAQRDEVKYFGAGASVGILGTGRNIFTPDQLKAQLASAKASEAGYIREIEALHKKQAAVDITLSEAKSLAEKGNISSVVAADIEGKGARAKAALSLREQELLSERALTVGVESEIAKRLAAATAADEAQLTSERHKVASEAKSEILGDLGLGRMASVGSLASKATIGGGAGAMAVGASVLVAGGIAYEGMKKIEESAAEFERAEDRVAIALTRSGLPLKLRIQEMDRLRGKAKEVADEFAMQDEEVKDVQATLIAYGGAAGKTLDRLTEITIGVSKATGLEYEMVAKMIAKGTDPENKAEMQRIGLYLDRHLTMQQRMNVVEREWGVMVDEAKIKMQGGTHEWDRLISKVDDLRKEKAHEIFEKIGNDIKDATPHILDMADAFGTKLVDGITHAETAAHDLVKPIREILNFASSVNGWLDKGYTTVGGAGAFIFNKLGLQVSEAQANAFRSMEGKDPLNPPIQLPALKSGHTSMFDPGGTAEDYLKKHKRPERSDGEQKSIESINREHFDKLREIVDAAEADRLAKLNVAHNLEQKSDHEFKKAELTAEVKYQQELSALMVDKRGKIINGLEQQYRTAQNEILVKNSEIVKETRDEDRETFKEQLNQTENYFRERDGVIDLANAKGRLSQKEYDRLRYEADRDALLAELGMIKFMLGEQSAEYNTYYKQLTDLEHNHAVKMATDLREQAKSRRELIDDTRKRHIEATMASYEQEYELAKLQYERDVRLAREAAKQKGDDQILVQQELYKSLHQLKEDYEARVRRIDQDRFENATGFKSAMQSGEAVANKGAFDAIDQQFNSGNNIAGTIGASLVKKGISAIEDKVNDKLSEEFSKILHTDVKNPQITALDANTQATIDNTNALRGTSSPAASTKLGTIDLGTGEITPEGIADKLKLAKYAKGTMDTGDATQLALLHPHEIVIPEGVDLGGGGLQGNVLSGSMTLDDRHIIPTPIKETTPQAKKYNQRLLAGLKHKEAEENSADAIIRRLHELQKTNAELFNSSSFEGGQRPEQGQTATSIGAFFQRPKLGFGGPLGFQQWSSDKDEKWQRAIIQTMLDQGKTADQVIEEVIKLGAEQRESVKHKVVEGMVLQGTMLASSGTGGVVRDAVADIVSPALTKTLGHATGHLVSHVVGDVAQHHVIENFAEGVAGGDEEAKAPAAGVEGRGSSDKKTSAKLDTSTAIEGTKGLMSLTKSISELGGASNKASKNVDKTKDSLATAFGAASKASLLVDPTGTAGTVIGLMGSLFGFEDGDYTGDGDPKHVAGVAHKREFYFDHKSTRQIGVGKLRALKYGRAQVVSNDLLPMIKEGYGQRVSLMPMNIAALGGSAQGGIGASDAISMVADRMESAVDRINNNVPASAMFGAMQSISRARSNQTWKNA